MLSPEIGHPSTLPREQTLSKTGSAENQTHKGWYATAIAVGVLLVVGGIFGTLGLLQSYYNFLPSSCDWLSHAIKVVGNTSHCWSLWLIACGGLLGVGTIAFGFYKICQAKTQDPVKQDQPVTQDPPPVNDPHEAMLGNHFSAHGRDAEYFSILPKGTYAQMCYAEIPETEPYCYVVVNDGELKCTALMTETQYDNFVAHLHNTGYIPTEEKVPGIEWEKRCEAMLGNHFTALSLDTELFNGLPNSSYNPLYSSINPPESCCCVVVKTHEGQLKCTSGINQTQSYKLTMHLRNKGYTGRFIDAKALKKEPVDDQLDDAHETPTVSRSEALADNDKRYERNLAQFASRERRPFESPDYLDLVFDCEEEEGFIRPWAKLNPETLDLANDQRNALTDEDKDKLRTHNDWDQKLSLIRQTRELMTGFGDYFRAVGRESSEAKNIQNKTYAIWPRRNEWYIVVRRTDKGQPECTKKVTKSETELLIKALNRAGYTQITK